MTDDTLTIGELAEAAGVTRRAVRFYVQRGLLETPEGRGRGSRYGHRHLERIRRIQDLQAAGHSLEAIRRILDGEEPDTASAPAPARRRQRGQRPAGLAAELWTRVRLAEGIELHVDLSRHAVEAGDLLRLKEALAAALEIPGPRGSSPSTRKGDR